jgi:hypothetical protein
MLFFIYKRWLPPVRGRESTHRLIVFLRKTKFSVRDALLREIKIYYLEIRDFIYNNSKDS